MIPARFDDRYDPEPDYELEAMRRYASEDEELDREREHWQAVRGEVGGQGSRVYREGGGDG